MYVAQAVTWRSGLSKLLTRYNGQGGELIGAALPTSVRADTAAGALAVSGTEREAVAEARDARRVTASAQRALSGREPSRSIIRDPRE